VSDVLDLAGGLKPDAVSLVAVAADEFTSALPTGAALDPDTVLVYQMNGVPLPAAHGFPARVLTPDRYGFKSAKWVVQLRAMNQRYLDWYGQRNWTADGIVKAMSRIDVPAAEATLAAGPQQIAGIAYAGVRGISRVEFSVDGGASWLPASFVEPRPDRDTWVRWQGQFDLPAGQTLQLTCRAYEGDGTPQIEQFSLPQPNGGTGLHSITVKGS
jgi:DMSO/TMAO reductase YedYZ molybdopterin-dependent catalytic subunit